MSEKQLEKMYEVVTSSINSAREDLRNAKNKLVFDKENEELIAYIAEREAKLAELRKERGSILTKA